MIQVNRSNDKPENQVVNIRIEDENKQINITDIDDVEITSEGTFLKTGNWYRALIHQDWDGNWWIQRDSSVLQNDTMLKAFKIRISEEHAKKILQELNAWDK